MKYKNFKEYFFAHYNSEEDATPQQVEELKREWQKKRVQKYQREYKKKHYRKELLFKEGEWRMVAQAAEDHNMKANQFIKSCLLAYLNQCFILPEDEDVKALEIAMIRYGTLLNQIARQVNVRGGALASEVQQIRDDYGQLRALAHERLRVPSTIQQLLEEELESDPRILPYLEQLIAQYKNRQDDSQNT
jgi:hypothetical protein